MEPRPARGVGDELGEAGERAKAAGDVPVGQHKSRSDGLGKRVELILPPMSGDVVAINPAKTINLRGIAEVAALGPHGSEKPPAKQIGVVARSRQSRARGRGVGADGWDHEAETHVVIAQAGSPIPWPGTAISAPLTSARCCRPQR